MLKLFWPKTIFWLKFNSNELVEKPTSLSKYILNQSSFLLVIIDPLSKKGFGDTCPWGNMYGSCANVVNPQAFDRISNRLNLDFGVRSQKILSWICVWLIWIQMGGSGLWYCSLTQIRFVFIRIRSCKINNFNIDPHGLDCPLKQPSLSDFIADDAI